MTLKTLPQVFTTAELDALVGQFPKNATVFRGEGIVTVSAPNGAKVLSAASRNNRQWHVMADTRIVQPA